LNTGNLSLTIGQNDYTLTAGDRGLECKIDPCELKLNRGAHEIRIQKDGFFPEIRNITIQRGQTESLKLELKKIPTLQVSSIIPPNEIEIMGTIPDNLKSQETLSPTWSPTKKQLAFIDGIDNKLKVEKEGKIQTIASLSGLSNEFIMLWSPNEKLILGHEKKDLYFIDIEKAARKKWIADFAPLNITWSMNSDYLIINDAENNLYRINWENKDLEPLNKNIDLKQSTWESTDRLIFYTYSEDENRTLIESLDLNTLETQEILNKFNAPIEKISRDETGNIYFYQTLDSTWYQLDY
jgi:hypothetical protein